MAGQVLDARGRVGDRDAARQVVADEAGHRDLAPPGVPGELAVDRREADGRQGAEQQRERRSGAEQVSLEDEVVAREQAREAREPRGGERLK